MTTRLFRHITKPLVAGLLAQTALLFGGALVLAGAIGTQAPAEPHRIKMRVVTPAEEREYQIKQLTEALLEQQRQGTAP